VLACLLESYLTSSNEQLQQQQLRLNRGEKNTFVAIYQTKDHAIDSANVLQPTFKASLCLSCSMREQL
jgi:hypothetical protein